MKRKGMASVNYQSLIYFKVVAEQCHYTRAANLLYITQPALSKAIRNLEKELGAQLFEKDGRNVSLTEYGRLFYDYVKRSVEEIDRGIEAVRHKVEVEHNTIFLGALFSMYALFLPEEIIRFRRRSPTSKFHLEYLYTSAILNGVLEGRYELGICSDFDNVHDCTGLNKYNLYKEEVSLFVAKNHPFASRASVDVSELRDQRFIVYVRSTRGTNKLLYDLCAPYGFTPNIVAEAYNDYGVIGAVSTGEGIAIIPSSGFINLHSVSKVNLNLDEPLMREINVVWRKSDALPPKANDFLEMLIEDAEHNTFLLS